jgi:hypothetical protein
MKSFGLIVVSVFLIMKSATAVSEPAVSYRSIRIDNLDIFYRESGPKDGPAILLLHGLPSS